MNASQKSKAIQLFRKMLKEGCDDCDSSCGLCHADVDICDLMYGQDVADLFEDYSTLVGKLSDYCDEYEMSECSRTFFSLAYCMDSKQAKRLYHNFRQEDDIHFDTDGSGFPCQRIKDLTAFMLSNIDEKYGVE